MDYIVWINCWVSDSLSDWPDDSLHAVSNVPRSEFSLCQKPFLVKEGTKPLVKGN